jgi:hypothetical protein
VRTEKLQLIRGLSNVKPPQSLDEALPTSGESETDEPLDLELLRLEADRRTPRKCRAASGMCGTTDTSLQAGVPRA